MGLPKGLHIILVLALFYPHFCDAQSHIELVTTRVPFGDQLVLKFDDCRSWHLAIETNNYQDWKAPPDNCRKYVREYMLGGQYEDDCFTATNISLAYVHSLLPLSPDGKDIWIFDIDETCLNNTPFYKTDDVAFGEPAKGAFFKWVEDGNIAEANRACLSLYKALRQLGVKIVFLTGMGEKFKQLRLKNMRQVGFDVDDKDMVFFRQRKEERTEAFKSRIRGELEEKKQFRIIGNLGDQWNDFAGKCPGKRTFKMPNPMYRF